MSSKHKNNFDQLIKNAVPQQESPESIQQEQASDEIQESVNEEKEVVKVQVKDKHHKAQVADKEPTDEELSLDARLLKYKSNPTDLQCLQAVLQQPETISYVKNSGKHLRLYAIQRSPEVIKLIDSPSLSELQEAAIYHPQILLDMTEEDENYLEINDAVENKYKELGITVKDVLSGRIKVPLDQLHSSLVDLL